MPKLISWNIASRIKARMKGEKVELHCVSVPPGSQYGGIKVEFLEAVARGISTREKPQLLVGDFNCPQVMEPEIVTWAKTRGKDNELFFISALGQRMFRSASSQRLPPMAQDF